MERRELTSLGWALISFLVILGIFVVLYFGLHIAHCNQLSEQYAAALNSNGPGSGAIVSLRDVYQRDCGY
jgi:hypothetical protein